MAATYGDLSLIARSELFRRRVAYALTSAAVAIYNESAIVTNHAQRAVYATAVTKNAYNLDGAVLAVLSDATIAGEASTSAIDNGITDAHIATAIAGVFNVLAGAGE